jgi:hypothetical protein
MGDRTTNGGEEMSRIIIDNQTGLTDVEAVRLVKRVMESGFESTETINGEEVPKYCHVTSFRHGVTFQKYIVYARPRKTKQSAYSFHVYAEEGEE